MLGPNLLPNSMQYKILSYEGAERCLSHLSFRPVWLSYLGGFIWLLSALDPRTWNRHGSP